jgi:hypothetical protein
VPESITTRSWLWISGSLAALAPRNDESEFFSPADLAFVG